jgi:hypothetical protein
MRLGFLGAGRSSVFIAVRMARDRPSQMDSSQCFGPDVAQVGEEFRGPGLRCVLSFPRRLERAVFIFFGPKPRKDFEF